MINQTNEQVSGLVKSPVSIFCIGLMCALLAGCHGKSIDGTIQTDGDFGKIECVAVPPFGNYSTDQPNAGRVIADLAGISLMREIGVSVLGRPEIDAVLKKQNINLTKRIGIPEAIWLGELFDTDAVLAGTVSEYSYAMSEGKEAGLPVVAIQAQLINTVSKEVVWFGEAAVEGKDYFHGKREPLTSMALVAVARMLRTMKRLDKKDRKMGFCGRTDISNDVDNDGILNLADVCPLQKETKNGYKDDDGCPEYAVKTKGFTNALSVDGDKIQLKAPLKFIGATNKIDPSSYGLLDKLAQFLQRNRNLKKVMIEGFYVNEASSRVKRLSFGRASAVKNYLVQRGVDQRRLIAVGYDLLRSTGEREIDITIVE